MSLHEASASLIGSTYQLLLDFGGRIHFFMLTSLLVDIFWPRKVIFIDIRMWFLHKIDPIMCKIVFDGLCLVDRWYQTTEKKVRGKLYDLKVQQILIRSVVPTLSYRSADESIFNVTEYRPAKSWEPKKSHFWYSDFFGYM